jgi:hypothetical protein
MTTRTLLINHLTGLKLAEWENEPNDITRLDEDPNGFWLIRVPDEEQYFLINPGDTIIFMELGRRPVDADAGLYAYNWYSHCASVTFKDYCDKENRLIKVKSYFRA